jgi:hypothetical protein
VLEEKVMSNYSDSASSVRVDFFKASGKWQATEAVMWVDDGYKEQSIHYAFALSLERHLTNGHGHLRYSGMVAICLFPYHEHSHPISLLVDEIPAWVAQKGELLETDNDVPY